MENKKILFFILIFTACSGFAKERKFDLHLNNGSIIEEVELKILKGDSLFYIHKYDERRIHVNDLSQLTLNRKRVVIKAIIENQM